MSVIISGRVYNSGGPWVFSFSSLKVIGLFRLPRKRLSDSRRLSHLQSESVPLGSAKDSETTALETLPPHARSSVPRLPKLPLHIASTSARHHDCLSASGRSHQTSVKSRASNLQETPNASDPSSIPAPAPASDSFAPASTSALLTPALSASALKSNLSNSSHHVSRRSLVRTLAARFEGSRQGIHSDSPQPQAQAQTQAQGTADSASKASNDQQVVVGETVDENRPANGATPRPSLNLCRVSASASAHSSANCSASDAISPRCLQLQALAQSHAEPGEEDLPQPLSHVTVRRVSRSRRVSQYSPLSLSLNFDSPRID